MSFSLTDISSWFTGADETVRGEADDAKLATLDNAAYAPGGTAYISILSTQGKPAADAAYAQVQSDIAGDVADTASYNSQVVGAAVDGAKTGLSSIGNFLDYPLFSIPLQWWLIAAVVLFFWIGGFGYIRGILKKKK